MSLSKSVCKFCFIYKVLLVFHLEDFLSFFSICFVIWSLQRSRGAQIPAKIKRYMSSVTTPTDRM